MQPGRTHRHPRYEEGNLGCMTSQLLIGAKRWEPSGSSLGHCGNNALRIITRTARYHITYTKKGGLDPLEAQVHVWCPRRDSKGLRFAKPRASDAWRPRHAPLQTGHRPVCLTLRALTRVRHEKGGLDPLERSLACMVPEARLEGPSLCEAPGFGRMAPSPRSATNRPQACLLNAPRAHASSARKRGP